MINHPLPSPQKNRKTRKFDVVEQITGKIHQLQALNLLDLLGYQVYQQVLAGLVDPAYQWNNLKSFGKKKPHKTTVNIDMLVNNSTI